MVYIIYILKNCFIAGSLRNNTLSFSPILYIIIYNIYLDIRIYGKVFVGLLILMQSLLGHVVDLRGVFFGWDRKSGQRI